MPPTYQKLVTCACREAGPGDTAPLPLDRPPIRRKTRTPPRAIDGTSRGTTELRIDEFHTWQDLSAERLVDQIVEPRRSSALAAAPRTIVVTEPCRACQVWSATDRAHSRSARQCV